MKVSRQPISADSSSYAKSEDDYCQQTTQGVDSPTETEEIHPTLKNQVQDPFLYYSNDRVRKRELRHQDVKDISSDRRSSSSSLSAQEQSTTTATQSSNTTASSPASTQVITSSKKRKKGHNHENESRFSFREPFLDKLRLMLDNETVADSGSIQWLDGEDAFVIFDQNKFEKDIIPKYFTPIIFQSFLRKLYRWGFKRITTTHAGSYKFASATFKRSPASSTTLNGTVGPASAGIAVNSTGQAPFLSALNGSALAMLLRQQSAANANAQQNQLQLSLLAQQLQQSLQPAVTQDNHLIAVLTNAIAQQTLPQIQLRQQINQNQTNSILQSLFAQQLVNQSVLHSLPSNMFSPAPNYNLMMSSVGPASQNPLSSMLNRNQVWNACTYAPTPSTVPSSEQVLSLLSGIHNSITATAASGTAHQEQGSARGTIESSSSAK